ncbi:protein of unknown function [Candidatus Filomicrobium marinum]|uniref:Uncharacterized protein n=1 Tax=Candidatus Filomicrobium marinum TaxID=1608628 RepID=A0A0D6JA61_9HYPH|nr:protein of unknown function [Candidatus Filomicrobium marinum]CPR15160.1 protein of unknown function [Candidatus Filomicrobium marinum]
MGPSYRLKPLFCHIGQQEAVLNTGSLTQAMSKSKAGSRWVPSAHLPALPGVLPRDFNSEQLKI